MEESILPKNLTLSYKKLHLYGYKKSQQKKVFLKLQIMKKTTKAVTERCSEKKMFFEILQNSQEKACARVSFLIKLQAAQLLKQLWQLLKFVYLLPFI